MPAFLGLLSCGYLLLFFWVAHRRDSYVLELEWLEGGVLDAAGRALHHQPIYVRPTHLFVPNIYTPAYYYLSALLARWWGLSFHTLRAFSVLATAACFATLAALAQRLTRTFATRSASLLSALVGAGLFAALYSVSWGWYDLARVDMLFLFLSLLATALSFLGWPLAAGLLFACAFQTKQSAALVALFVLAHELRRPRKLLLGLGSFGAATLASSFLLNRLSGGWYAYYTAVLPRHQGWISSALVSFPARDLCSPLGLALILTGWSFASPARRALLPPRTRLFLAFTTAGYLLSSFLGRLHSGGAINVVLPAYAWVAVLFAVSLALLRTHYRASAVPVPEETGIAGRLKCVLPQQWEALALAMAAVQFAGLLYTPAHYIPTPQAQAEAVALMRRLAGLPGNIYVFDNVADLIPAGKPTFATTVAIYDVLRADHGPIAAQLRRDVDNAIRGDAFSSVLSDKHLDASFPYPGAPPDLASHFRADVISLLSDDESQRLGIPDPPELAPTYLFPRSAAPPQP